MAWNPKMAAQASSSFPACNLQLDRNAEQGLLPRSANEMLNLLGPRHSLPATLSKATGMLPPRAMQDAISCACQCPAIGARHVSRLSPRQWPSAGSLPRQATLGARTARELCQQSRRALVMALRSEQALLSQCIMGQLEFYIEELPTTPPARAANRGPSRVNPWPECVEEVVQFLKQADRTEPTFRKYDVGSSDATVKCTFSKSSASGVMIGVIQYLAALSHHLGQEPFDFIMQYKIRREGKAKLLRPDLVVVASEEEWTKARVLVVVESYRAGYFEKFEGAGRRASTLPSLAEIYNREVQPDDSKEVARQDGCRIRHNYMW